MRTKYLFGMKFAPSIVRPLFQKENVLKISIKAYIQNNKKKPHSYKYTFFRPRIMVSQRPFFWYNIPFFFCEKTKKIGAGGMKNILQYILRRNRSYFDHDWLMTTKNIDFENREWIYIYSKVIYIIDKCVWTGMKNEGSLLSTNIIEHSSHNIHEWERLKIEWNSKIVCRDNHVIVLEEYKMFLFNSWWVQIACKYSAGWLQMHFVRKLNTMWIERFWIYQ